MSVLLPFFLGAGLLVGVPILLHLLRGKPNVTLIFPTLRFLGPTAVRETRRHQLRRWITLLLRCLVILLLCAAFARPFWNAAHENHGRAVVVAVDNSFSMQTQGRWKPMRSWAAHYLSDLKPGDQVGILLMNPAPHWLMPLSDQLDQTRAILTSLEPGYETTRYEGALRLAGDVLLHSGAQNMQLVWMGDEQRVGWQGVDFSEPLPNGVQLELPPLPAPPVRQAAITKVTWEAAPEGSIGLRVQIAQFIPDTDTRSLIIRAGDKILATQKVQLQRAHANSTLVVLNGIVPDKLESLRIDLDPDDLPADDTYYIVHHSDDGTHVLLSPMEGSPNSFDFIRHAINSTREVVASPLKAEDLPDSEWPTSAVVILRGAKPFQEPQMDRLNRFLKAGGAAWILLNGSPEQQAWMKEQRLEVTAVPAPEEEAPLHLRNWDIDHPLLAPLTETSLMALLNIDFYHGFSIGGLSALPIATWEDGTTALAEVNSNGERFFVSGFDLNREVTNWPIEASFVPFVHSTALWLLQQKPVSQDWRVGDSIPLASDGTWEGIDTPTAQPLLHVSKSARPTVPGLYRFTSGVETHLYAVNVKPEESDPTAWPDPQDINSLARNASKMAEAKRTATILSQEQNENQQRLWWWLMVIVIVFLLMELPLANRTTP